MTTTSTLFAGRQIARRLVTLAAFAAASIGASSAHASFFNFDHDQADLVNPRASFVLAAMNWGQTIGGGTVRGALTGQLTYHGALAGCAKVRAVWRNAAGAEVATDVTREACSNTSAPSLPVAVNEDHASTVLRTARLELQVREANGGSYRTVASRSMKAGD